MSFGIVEKKSHVLEHGIVETLQGIGRRVVGAGTEMPLFRGALVLKT
jgi:hypothetical protein